MSSQRDVYKTKLCSLFARGNCPRTSCNFAHGEHELRRDPLRDRQPAYSSGKYERTRYESERGRSNDRRRSRSRSPAHRRGADHRRSHDRPHYRQSSDRDHVKRSRSDKSGRYEGRILEGSSRLDNPSTLPELEDEAHYLQGDVKHLEEKCVQLEERMGRRTKSIDSLTAELSGLEDEVAALKTENNDVLEKLRRVIRAQQRVIRSQEDIKRYQGKLEKVMEEVSGVLGSSLENGDVRPNGDRSLEKDAGGDQPRDHHFGLHQSQHRSPEAVVGVASRRYDNDSRMEEEVQIEN